MRVVVRMCISEIAYSEMDLKFENSESTILRFSFFSMKRYGVQYITKLFQIPTILHVCERIRK